MRTCVCERACARACVRVCNGIYAGRRPGPFVSEGRSERTRSSCDHGDTFKQTHYEDSGNLSCLPGREKPTAETETAVKKASVTRGTDGRICKRAPGLSENTKEAPRGPDKQTILYQIKKKKRKIQERKEGKTLPPSLTLSLTLLRSHSPLPRLQRSILD